MRLVDVGVDAARILRVVGPGQVRAVFSKALYLQAPGGLVVLASTAAPRGPLHLRVPVLPAVAAGCPVQVTASGLSVGARHYRLDAPTWCPELPSGAALGRARRVVRRWLPDEPPTLDLGPAGRAELPGPARADLRRGDLLSFAARVSGRGPGLTPAGDDLLAGVLLTAWALGSGSAAERRTLRECAHRARTNDVARAFLACAAQGRCIEPVHDLLTALADGDRRAVASARVELGRFGSSSGPALTYGVRVGLLAGQGRAVLAHDQGVTAYSEWESRIVDAALCAGVRSVR